MPYNKDKLQVAPTSGSLVMIKERLKAITMSHELLKRKSDALVVKFKTISKKLIEVRRAVNEGTKEAALSLAQARYLAGDINATIMGKVDQGRVRVIRRLENVAGVIMTSWESFSDGVDTYEYAGLSRGGQQLKITRDQFGDLVNLVVELASLQSCFVKLDEIYCETNRKAAALQRVVIPRLENTLNYIRVELDDSDREDFYRMKRIQAKKKSAGKPILGIHFT